MTSYRRLGAALLVLMLWVAGCSSSSDSGEGTDFTPYVDVTGTHTSLSALAATTGQKNYVLAFVLAQESSCQASWGGTKALGDSALLQEIADLKAQGGSVTVATGGANGTYLENACSTVDSLVAAYENVLDTVGTNSLDLDIEQSVDVGKVTQALKQLQDARGTSIMLTLKVQNASTGLTNDAMELLRAAQSAGVDVTVNAMLMNFADTGDWGSDLVTAMSSVETQIRRVWTDLDDDAAYRKLGVTLMIGQNDTGQVTTTDVAKTVVAKAHENDIAFLSFWSVNRDTDGCAGSTTTSGTCSGVSQSAYEFTNLFRAS